MMNVKLCTSVAAAASLALLAACAGETPGPGSMLAPTSAQRHAAGDVTTDATPQVGHVILCKEGTSGTFTVSRTPFGGASSGVVASPVTVDAGQCKVVATDVSPSGSASDIVINETSADPVSANYSGTTGSGSGAYVDNVTSLRINQFHGYTVTYVNAVHPTSCTYTKGWYRNKNGSATIDATIDGRTVAQQRAIFDATPGKPGMVTWTGGNNTLNLYQQLLAALNNLDGNATGGPPAVDQAIADALAATGGSGLHITVAAGTDVSGLIEVLSSFNEGEYANVGFPHCDAETVIVPVLWN